MKKNIVLIFLVVLAVVLFLSFYDSGNSVCFDTVCFSISIADDSLSRAQGLMFVDYLDEGEGMLFVYESPGDYRFWMKNTLIPLDMIWIDEDFKVVYIATASPCVVEDCALYGSSAQAKYILEINSGLADTYGITVGDYVRID